MNALDLVVIVVYALGMLAIGWYFSRRTDSTEEFLLGGRQMNPVLIGLSLFATIVSSLSYLTWPEEVIGHGPMLYAQICAYPLALAIVGWGLIPYFMRQPVTSAYELLEVRLGMDARRTAASIFLLSRLGWMAAIIFATSSKVIVPLLDLDPAMVPWICLAMGLVTIAYSSSGGFRAVVLTDSVQSIIMLAGAAVVVGIVTVRMGGVSAWWPQGWYEHWDPATWHFSDAARVTFPGVILSWLCWYVCMAGSDQMAIQRYLATRDAKTARRSLVISLVSDMVIAGLLVLAGLAVLGYFRARDPSLPAGGDLVAAAGTLFPRFIAEELPGGVRGLLIVALMAAAMSSLSSGINSSCAVLTTDFLEPWQAFQRRRFDQVKVVRWLSFVIGILAVLLSLPLGSIEGNLYEMCMKTVNLLTAPLFVLFFLALFVPWITHSGAFVGLACSIATAVAVAYFYKELGLTFIWMAPSALVIGVATGAGWSAALRVFGLAKSR